MILKINSFEHCTIFKNILVNTTKVSKLISKLHLYGQNTYLKIGETGE